MISKFARFGCKESHISKQKDGKLFYNQGLKFEEVIIYFESVVMECKIKKIKGNPQKYICCSLIKDSRPGVTYI